MRDVLSVERAHELFSYNPLTGEVHWKKRNANSTQEGDPAGYIWTGPTGRKWRRLKADHRNYQAHRVIWLMQTGVWPICDIDHKDGDGLNNCWSNLRDVTKFENLQNQRRAHTNSSTGLLGVSKRGKRFSAKISLGRKQIALGCFDTPEQAHQAYLDAKRKIHPGCTL